jgi:lipoate-protein ligase A
VSSLTTYQDGSGDGDQLMAADLTLLQQCSDGQIGPTLRFYTWAVPTISLGFHQMENVLDHAQMLQDHMPWTRRPTGGAAVLHSDELTYAIVASAPDARAGKRLQHYVSLAIAEGLRKFGVQADVDERGEPLSALPNRTSCFVRTSRWEVTARGRKLVGSAQRKLGDAYLQHGSILVGEDHLRIVNYLAMTNEPSREQLHERLKRHATSISTELGYRIALEDLRQALAQSFQVHAPLLYEADSAVALS